jgi:hypothetical protein
MGGDCGWVPRNSQTPGMLICVVDFVVLEPHSIEESVG